MDHQVNLDTPLQQPVQQPDGTLTQQPDLKRILANVLAAVRKDKGGPQASADGNWIFLTVNQFGSLRVDSSNANLFNSDPTTLTEDKESRAQLDRIEDLLTQILGVLQEKLY